MTTARKMPAKPEKAKPVSRATTKKTASVAKKTPARCKATAKVRPATTPRAPAAPAAAVTSQPPAASARREVSPEERFRMTQEAAYLIAEKDGFRHHPDRYWFAAERQTKAMLSNS